MQTLPLSNGRVILLPPKTKKEKLPACFVCNTPEQVAKYEGKGLAGKLFPGKLGDVKGLIKMNRLSDYEFHCTKCGWSRTDPAKELDATISLWFVSCPTCNERHISTEIDKCAHCDLEIL